MKFQGESATSIATPAEPKAAIYDVAVVGAGPAGLACALATAAGGAHVAIVAPAFDEARSRPDQRTTALLGGSADLIETLGLSSDLAAALAPLRAIRLIDDMGGIVRSGEVIFHAGEIGQSAFGQNIANLDLVRALARAAMAHPRISWHETAAVTQVRPGNTSATVCTSEGATILCRLVAAADGRNSIARSSAEICTKTWDYPQVAVATVFTHARPHGDISTEFHRPHGPMTTVPMPPREGRHCSSLVWVVEPGRAQALMEMDDSTFGGTLESELQGLLGRIPTVGHRASFKLGGLTAARMAARRIALVGEAAHVIPPIGAQGLNLGLRDGATLAEIVADALTAGRDPGGPQALDAYDERRRHDIASRTTAVDLLNRSLLHDIFPVHLARGIGLFAVSLIPPLRRAVMRSGMEPVGRRPRLMQPGARIATAT